MCGIAGASTRLIENNPEKILKAMNSIAVHRGPDDSGIYLDKGMGLAQTRLSIIDLSERGRQPMVSEDGQQVISFNGEIYNFPTLKKELQKKGYEFKTATDTEVLLNAYREYGAQALEKLRGMFAFAIWDKKKEELFLCRDRIGKKPLYYFYDGRNIAFASEIKSLVQIPGIPLEIEETSILDYLKYTYVPHPKSIYKNIYKLEPGHFLTYDSAGRIKMNSYWDIDFTGQVTADVEEITDELFSLVKECIDLRLLSDVPLGAFLSGGIDSSAVVALMQQIKNDPVKTFTIGFKGSGTNEAEQAKEFAENYGTDHSEHYVHEDVDKIIKKLVWHFDEPFSDSSMVPTYHVCKMARKNVTVALSGDGGDESFGGYSKYIIEGFEHKFRMLFPKFILRTLSSIFGACEQGYGKKIHSLSHSAALPPDMGFYISNSACSDTMLVNLLSTRLKQQTEGYSPFHHTERYYNAPPEGVDHFSRILYTDLKSYLPGDILTKVDRMSMANSLEVRAPLLDHKLIEFSAKIPAQLKFKNKNTKIVLKKTFEKILSPELMKRPKQGFEAPVDKWIRTTLKETVHQYLFKKEYMAFFFDLDQVNIIWNRYFEQKMNYSTNIWSLYIFSLWYEECFSAAPKFKK